MRKKNVVVEEVKSLVEETVKDVVNGLEEETTNTIVLNSVSEETIKEEVLNIIKENKNLEKFVKTDTIYEFSFEEKILKINNVQQVIKSKSDIFRSMYNNGMEVCEIAKVSKSHYSFVYEVIAKSNGQVRNIVKESKSDEFRILFDKGLTVGQIAKQTNSNYSFVHTCIKKYKESKEESKGELEVVNS